MLKTMTLRVLTLLLLLPVAAATATPPAPDADVVDAAVTNGEAAEDAAAGPTGGEEDPLTLVEVNWGEELLDGGVTIIALGLLSALMLAFAVERFIVLRRDRFAPRGLARKVEPMFQRGEYDQIVQQCARTPSTLSRCIAYVVEHRDADPDALSEGAGDLAGRDMADQDDRNAAFSVVAALAPLLGLLGTMIGMIEAFKLVEVFGDEGGASMLAGSISKALITTAVGLILAIPAISLFHWFKHRVHVLSQDIEHDMDFLMTRWFMHKRKPAVQPTNSRLPASVAVGKAERV
jgi:biopolymer transport protein ExbB